MDIGMVITGFAAFAVLAFGRGKWLRHLLFLSWSTVALAVAAGVSMSTVVFTMTILDISIAGAAVIIATHAPPRYDARAVGAVSMALIPAHWAMSITQGAADWTLYAAACNAGFVLQCLIVGGWLDGVASFLGRVIRRFDPVRSLRQHRGR